MLALHVASSVLAVLTFASSCRSQDEEASYRRVNSVFAAFTTVKASSVSRSVVLRTGPFAAGTCNFRAHNSRNFLLCTLKLCPPSCISTWY